MATWWLQNRREDFWTEGREGREGKRVTEGPLSCVGSEDRSHSRNGEIRTWSNCDKLDQTPTPQNTRETIAKSLWFMGNGWSRSNLIKLWHQISWRRDDSRMEEKIFEQKVTKVTKGRESQRTFILCGVGRPLAQQERRNSNLIELRQTWSNSNTSKYQGNNRQKSMIYGEWLKSIKLDQTLTPNFVATWRQQNGREDFWTEGNEGNEGKRITEDLHLVRARKTARTTKLAKLANFKP